MGTPQFAVEALKKIRESNYQVVGVVCPPDKPAGRGHKLKSCEVKQYAVSQNLNILQPEKLKCPKFLHELNSLNADIFIVVAFRMLPKEVWSIPKYGTFNIHASLLPQYRGAAPINWALIYGEKKTGVTSFLIDENFVIRHQVVNDHPLGRNVDEMIRMVDALDFHTENGEVCPAGWNKGEDGMQENAESVAEYLSCLLYTSPSPRDATLSRMPSSA